MNETILNVHDLNVAFHHRGKGKMTQVLDHVSFDVERGKILGIVGESGSGKSVCMHSILRLLGGDAEIRGEVLFDGKDLLSCSEKEMRAVRGGRISMVFQDPMTALNPVYTIGTQIKESLRHHRSDISNKDAYIIDLLASVGISDGKRRLRQYPHEVSGGIRQRIAIAMALASDPDILIADEPTTALDVTVQAQIIALIRELTRKRNMTTIIITHDLGIVAGLCDNVIVLYGGRICEKGTTREIFTAPKHEYTRGLLAAVPGAGKGGRLVPISGSPVNLDSRPDGCAFCPRCAKAMEVCLTDAAPAHRFSETHEARCWINEIPEGLTPFAEEGEG